jgi:hypothetical protein
MKFYLHKVSLLALAIAGIAVMAPGLASAHGSGDKDNSGRDDRKIEQRHNMGLGTVNEFGIHVFDNDDGDKRGKAMGGMQGMFYVGTVTAVSGSGFTMDTNADTTLTVNTNAATLIRIPRSVIALSDVQVGDKVHVTGTKTGSTIAASVVYDKSANVKFGVAKGTVTATSGTTLTVQSKNGETATVNTDGDTQIMQDGEAASFDDIEVGTKVKIFGLWDQILHVFSALKIVLK